MHGMRGQSAQQRFQSPQRAHPDVLPPAAPARLNVSPAASPRRPLARPAAVIKRPRTAFNFFTNAHIDEARADKDAALPGGPMLRVAGAHAAGQWRGELVGRPACLCDC